MKSISLTAALVLCLGSVALAGDTSPAPATKGRFEIVTFPGSSGLRVILLDKSSGDTWVWCPSEGGRLAWCALLRDERAAPVKATAFDPDTYLRGKRPALPHHSPPTKAADSTR